MAPYSKINDSKHCFVKNCSKRLTFMEKNTCLCSKCEHYHCTIHRLAESHSCFYDFTKDINIDSFIKANKCIGEKIIKL